MHVVLDSNVEADTVGVALNGVFCSLWFQVLYVQAAVMVWLTTTLMKKLFFGTLRAAEVEVHI